MKLQHMVSGEWQDLKGRSLASAVRRVYGRKAELRMDRGLCYQGCKAYDIVRPAPYWNPGAYDVLGKAREIIRSTAD